jgi:L-lactate dehydrogenase complex protein LldG
MSDRELILRRIRDALADVPRDEAGGGALGAHVSAPAAADQDGLEALFAERCGDYRATVTACADGPGAIAAAVGAACRRHGARRVLVPSSLEEVWLPDGLEAVVDDPPLSVDELDRCDGVLTGCALAIAMTGTIVLDGGRGQGRRALTLVPDLHVCVVRGPQILSDVPAAFEALGGALAAGRPVTLISGPSATSDIELTRVEGVHGPRRLEVILASARP